MPRLRNLRPAYRLALNLVAVAWLLSALGARPALSATPADVAEEAQGCMKCHGDDEKVRTMDNGETVSLLAHPEAVANSVHKTLRCTECHVGMNVQPHPERPHANLAQWKAGFVEVCKTCHFANYTKTLDSVHSDLQTRGDVFAPTCVKCHGSHEMARPSQPRSRISQTCATCHPGVSAKYVKSVHGKALLEDGNTDVPVCTDCHRSHDIAAAKDRAWLLRSPNLCGRCHGDSKLMGKYGLSAAVLSTYVADFHGTTAGFGTDSNDDGSQRLVAVCSDCHGIHDIASVKSTDSGAFRANLVKTCRKCHPEASANFPAAWLSHYEPSFWRTPLVYSVKIFYLFLVPFIVGGLILQILLHLWRMVVKR